MSFRAHMKNLRSVRVGQTSARILCVVKVALTYECDRIETNDKFGCVARCSACGWTDINVSGALNFSKQETSFKVKLSVKH